MAVNTISDFFFRGAPLAVGTSVVPASGSFVLNGRREAFNAFTVGVVTTGAPTSYSVQVQGSLDNVTWVNVGAAITADGFYAVTVANQFFTFLRANITSVVGGTNPTITMPWVASS